MTSIPSSKKKRAKYDGQSEYRAIQAKVEHMIDLGYTARAIFEEMSRKGRLTIAYTTFCEYVRGGGRRLRKFETRSRPDAPNGERPEGKILSGADKNPAPGGLSAPEKSDSPAESSADQAEYPGRPVAARIGRNMGRVELLAVRESVDALLKAGYDLKKIHSRLVAEGSVSMSYTTFCYQFKQFRNSDPMKREQRYA